MGGVDRHTICSDVNRNVFRYLSHDSSTLFSDVMVTLGDSIGDLMSEPSLLSVEWPPVVCAALCLLPDRRQYHHE